MKDLIKNIRKLQAEAEMRDMDIDWETGKLVEKPLKAMTPHQRDFYVREQRKREYFKDYYANADNDPASPEQAGW